MTNNETTGLDDIIDELARPHFAAGATYLQLWDRFGQPRQDEFVGALDALVADGRIQCVPCRVEDTPPLQCGHFKYRLAP